MNGIYILIYDITFHVGPPVSPGPHRERSQLVEGSTPGDVDESMVTSRSVAPEGVQVWGRDDKTQVEEILLEEEYMTKKEYAPEWVVLGRTIVSWLGRPLQRVGRLVKEGEEG